MLVLLLIVSTTCLDVFTSGLDQSGSLISGIEDEQTFNFTLRNPQLNWKSACSGKRHHLVLTQGGELWAGGENTHSKLGLGSGMHRPDLERVGLLSSWRYALFFLFSSSKKQNTTTTTTTNGGLQESCLWSRVLLCLAE